MAARKNWFTKLCLWLFLLSSAFSIILYFMQWETKTQYLYFYSAYRIFFVASFVLTGYFFAASFASCSPFFAKKNVQVERFFEWSVGLLILAASCYVRVRYIQRVPMEPAGDYKIYYELAKLIKEGNFLQEGGAYCDYVALFPHTYGYSFFLSLVMSLFGTSVFVAQMLNVLCALGACFFCWRATTMLTGKFLGLFALALSAFWPSQIMFNNFLTDAYLFSCLFFFSMWLFLRLVIRYKPTNPSVGMVLHVVLGIALAVTAFVRPMALLLLLPLVLFLIPSKMELPLRPSNELPLMLRLLSKGWFRALVIVVVYFLVSTLFGMFVSNMVDREVVRPDVSIGYSLMVGMNTESIGGRNVSDLKFLFDAYRNTDSASLAHKACIDTMLERLQSVHLDEVLDVLVRKFSNLWTNDNYAASLSRLFMRQQGTLTNERDLFFSLVLLLNNAMYIAVVVFSAIASIFMLRRKGNWAIVPLTVNVFMVVISLFVENQYHYHFHALYIYALLTAVAFHYIFHDFKEASLAKREENRRKKEQAKIAKRIKKEQASMKTDADMQKSSDEVEGETPVSQGNVDEQAQMEEPLIIKQATQQEKDELGNSNETDAIDFYLPFEPFEEEEIEQEQEENPFAKISDFGAMPSLPYAPKTQMSEKVIEDTMEEASPKKAMSTGEEIFQETQNQPPKRRRRGTVFPSSGTPQAK